MCECHNAKIQKFYHNSCVTNQSLGKGFLKDFNFDGSSKTTGAYGFPSVVHVEAQNLTVNKNGERKYEEKKGNKTQNAQ